MPIYTRTGDQGTTSLYSNQRVSKGSAVIDFIGSLDELNARLGMCVSSLSELDGFDEEIDVLQEIQSDLFRVGAVAAGANIKFYSVKETENIEKTIDDYDKLLPKLKNFILPGGSVQGADLHHARTNVRKIERDAIRFKSASIMSFVPYLNRLSDLLFVMARYVNSKTGKKEIVWSS